MIAPQDERTSAFDDDVSALDAASYIHQITAEIAGIAARTGLARVAAALNLARDFAADALREARENPQREPGNPAPGDAA